MKHRKAQLATGAMVLVALGIALARHKPAPAQDPQDAIYAMLAAARAGDVKAYLGNYTGQMEAALRQSLAETNETSFSKYLKDSNSEMKGIAVSDPLKTSDLEAKVQVEYIYQDRNETQTMYLEKGSKGWKISRADNDNRITPLIPYGTPVR